MHVEKSSPAYRRLGTIVRETNRDLREHGVYDLYIGYPFVEGALPGEDGFPVRAPLALFPVCLDKRSDRITVSYDESRDAVFNTTLILAMMKATATKGDPADAVIDDQRAFPEQLSAFYLTVGLEFSVPAGTAPLTEYRGGSFPSYGPGTTRWQPPLTRTD